eukprot:TRINITY_DN1922_c0_g1_i1.p2 TRINITY_DN1922_c0_g1~~TRINITY_DN1922_c0_g1_i1.p2  ORF type:complete len:161 (+),score=13.57 TRINITY_DN1922_c0_g1_i1:464-946(+)
MRSVIVLLGLVGMQSLAVQSKTAFGHGMRKEFMLAEGFTNLNHGSFGSTPRKVIDQQRVYTEQMEAYPDLWFRGEYFKYVEKVRSDLAKYVGADSADIVLIENASTGVNSIFRSLKLTSADAVLVTSIAYSMVPNTLRRPPLCSWQPMPRLRPVRQPQSK